MIGQRFSEWFREGVYSLLTRMAVVLFGFCNLIILVRVYTEVEVGVWILFTSVVAIVETARTGFIRNPLLAHLSGIDPAETTRIISSSFFLHILTGLVFSIMIFLAGDLLAAFWHTDSLRDLFHVYALTNLVVVLVLQLEFLMQWKMNFKGIFYANTVRLGLFFLYLVTQFIVERHPSLMELAIGHLFAAAAAIVVSRLVAGRSCWSALFHRPRRETVALLFHMGKYTIGTNISSMFIKSTDSWMLGRMLSSRAVAMYNPAIRISNLVEVPTLAIANLVFPHVNRFRMERGNGGLQDLYVKSVSLILAIIAPAMLLVWLFADQLVNFILGPAYGEAATILRVTVFYTLIIPFNRQFGTILDGLKRPKLNFYLLVMVAVLNVIFNIVLIHQFGVIGAAYGTLMAYCVVFMLNQIILSRDYGINTLDVLVMVPRWYGTGVRLLQQELTALR